MAKKNEQSRGDEKVKWQGFVNYDATNADIEPFRAFLADTDVIQSELVTALESGYRVSLSYDRVSDCVVCSLYANNASLSHAGYALTQRSKDWYKAICKALYVHSQVFKKIWPTVGKSSRDDLLE